MGIDLSKVFGFNINLQNERYTDPKNVSSAGESFYV